ncbi:hypothetical protein [Amycolatopsis sp. H20-H5]|uniref:hypothetical protein n=1 Tax=Amycolatopsis sp. H20-H5 TaxID=3046309 RepID=UPI002DB828D8|nr:hypothetical protein [Amycolatopsis sp. H20-H5]MEC3979652.1 hypothetical protein [Amycolatopsis sp. H20-H5]
MSIAVIDDTPFDHQPSGTLSTLLNGQRKIDKPDREIDLVVLADVVGQDARSKRSSVPRDALELIQDRHGGVVGVHYRSLNSKTSALASSSSRSSLIDRRIGWSDM